MATPYIMPLGFIDQPTETGATFIPTNPPRTPWGSGRAPP